MPQSLGLSVDGKNSWILDSGAIDRLISSSEHCLLYPCAGNEKIRKVEGSLAPIASKGQIVIFDDFSLHNVLHVPKFSYNLLSISKITCELHYKANSDLNLFVFRTWVRGGRLALTDIARDFTSLMMIPPVLVSLGLVYCLPIVASLDMTLCCGIFGWVTRTLLIWNIYFPIFFLKSMSPCYFVMCAFEQNNIEFLFPHNHINPLDRLPLSIVVFGVLPRSQTHLGNGGL